MASLINKAPLALHANQPWVFAKLSSKVGTQGPADPSMLGRTVGSIVFTLMNQVPTPPTPAEKAKAEDPGVFTSVRLPDR